MSIAASRTSRELRAGSSLPPDAVRVALGYSDRNKAEIDDWIELNELPADAAERAARTRQPGS